MSQALALSVAGVLLGVFGAFLLTRIIKNLLFHVNATDPATFFAAAEFFVIVALSASSIPARRAAKIDPMTT